MQKILIGLVILGIIAAIVVLLLSSGNLWIILLGSFVMLSSIILAGLTWYGYMDIKTNQNENDVESLSKSILKETDKEKYAEKCDSLFKMEDPETYKQFIDMKLKRPISEINNLCGNLAKQKLNFI